MRTGRGDTRAKIQGSTRKWWGVMQLNDYTFITGTTVSSKTCIHSTKFESFLVCVHPRPTHIHYFGVCGMGTDIQIRIWRGWVCFGGKKIQILTVVLYTCVRRAMNATPRRGSENKQRARKKSHTPHRRRKTPVFRGGVSWARGRHTVRDMHRYAAASGENHAHAKTHAERDKTTYLASSQLYRDLSAAPTPVTVAPVSAVRL